MDLQNPIADSTQIPNFNQIMINRILSFQKSITESESIPSLYKAYNLLAIYYEKEIALAVPKKQWEFQI